MPLFFLPKTTAAIKVRSKPTFKWLPQTVVMGREETTMAKQQLLPFLLLWLLSTGWATGGDWSILGWKKKVSTKEVKGRSLKNYCESWRMNVELNNIRDFTVVPEECTEYIGRYMASTQYKADSELAAQECALFLSCCCFPPNSDDAWIFDIDDTLLSTLPYYRDHHYGGEEANQTSLESWMRKGEAPALEHSLKLYNQMKAKGMKIFLVSSRRERLRSATVDNLISVGYQGWTALFLRGVEEERKEVGVYKEEVRRKLRSEGYEILGIMGDLWSSFNCGCSRRETTTTTRVFKLPNPLLRPVILKLSFLLRRKIRNFVLRK